MSLSILDKLSLPLPNPEHGSLARTPAVRISVDGVALEGAPRKVDTVMELVKAKPGSSSPALAFKQGDLMQGKAIGGDTVFFLRGQAGADYLLRSPDGKPIANLVAAKERASALIRSGAAARLREVSPASVPSQKVTKNLGNDFQRGLKGIGDMFSGRGNTPEAVKLQSSINTVLDTSPLGGLYKKAIAPAIQPLVAQPDPKPDPVRAEIGRNNYSLLSVPGRVGKFTIVNVPSQGLVVIDPAGGPKRVFPAGTPLSLIRQSLTPAGLPKPKVSAELSVRGQIFKVTVLGSIYSTEVDGNKVEASNATQLHQRISARMKTTEAKNRNPDPNWVGQWGYDAKTMSVTVPVPKDFVTFNNKVNFGSTKAMYDGVLRPVFGLAKAVTGDSRLIDRLDRKTGELNRVAKSVNIADDDPVVKGSALFTEGVMAAGTGFGTGVVAKGAVSKFLLWGATPVASTVGNDAANNDLGWGTVGKATFNVGTGVVVGKLPIKSAWGQAAVGTAFNTGTQTILTGKAPTLEAVGTSFVTNWVGVKASQSAQNRRAPPLHGSTNTSGASSPSGRSRSPDRASSPFDEIGSAVKAYEALTANATPAQRGTAAVRVKEAQQGLNSHRDDQRAKGQWSTDDKTRFLAEMKKYGSRADKIGSDQQYGGASHSAGHAVPKAATSGALQPSKAGVAHIKKTPNIPVTSGPSNKMSAGVSNPATLSAANLKDKATQSIAAANAAVKHEDAGKLAVQITALKTIQNDCRKAGQNGLADTIGVHVKNFDAQRKALHRQGNEPQHSSAFRPPSNAALTSAMRISAVSSDFRSIENPKRFLAYVDKLDGQSLSTLLQVGMTGVSLQDSTLINRSKFYRTINAGNLISTNYGLKHDWHLVFGTPSKLGEVNANSRSFDITSNESWAQRGQLPGQGGVEVSEFWKPDLTQQFKAADDALKKLAAFDLDEKGASFDLDVVRPLSDMGFIPKGSPLATRLERLEGTIGISNTLSAQVTKTDSARLPPLLNKLKVADNAVVRSVRQFAAQATQLRSEILIESFGSPKTTYELTMRYAAGARYMQSVENEVDPVFDAAKFKQILAEVKAEAGSEETISLTWHRELLKTYERDAVFNQAMQESEPMHSAWTAYKAKYGL